MQTRQQNPLHEVQFYLTSAMTILGAVSFVSIYKNQRKIDKLEKRIEFVQDRRPYSPTELKDVMSNTTKAKDARFKPVLNKDNGIEGFSGQVLVKGFVASSPWQAPLTTITSGYFLNKKIESVLRIRYKEEIYSNDQGDPSRGRYVINLKRILENCQVDSQREFLVKDNSNQVIVSNFDRINYEKALEVLDYKEQKRSQMIHEYLFTLGVLGVKFLAQLFFKNVDTDSFRGISVGVRDSEVGIKVGSGIAVIGQVFYNWADKTMRIEKPELILQEGLSYVAQLKKQLEAAAHNRNVWLVVAIVSSLYVGRQFFKYLRRTDNLPRPIKNVLYPR